MSCWRSPGKSGIFQRNRIIKKEYIYRIENPEKTPDYYIPISEIASQIERRTKITPGELYPILEDLNKKDFELTLIDNPEEPEDKKIKILPFSDETLNFSLSNFRPEEYSAFRIIVTKNFSKALRAKREKNKIFKLKKEIPNQTESQKSLLELLNNLYKYYPLYSDLLSQVPNTQKLLKQLNKWVKAIEKLATSSNSKTV